LNILVVVVSALGANELATLFERKDARYRAATIIIPLLGAAIPLTQLFVVSGGLEQSAVTLVMMAMLAAVLLVQVFRHTADGFRHTLTSIAANFTLVLYPGLFLSHIVRIASYENASVLILTFLCAVFFNDTMAYIAGLTYRSIRTRLSARHNEVWEPRYVFPVSPKKTVVGFVGGFLLSPAVLVAAEALFPEALPGSYGAAILIGSAVGLATIIGDLVESAIKRSATSKDSGGIIPGRGGILDSVDSVLYAAPVFYYLLRYLA
jgi:phosphatidate cytidylyltransferase